MSVVRETSTAVGVSGGRQRETEREGDRQREGTKETEREGKEGRDGWMRALPRSLSKLNQAHGSQTGKDKTPTTPTPIPPPTPTPPPTLHSSGLDVPAPG